MKWKLFSIAACTTLILSCSNGGNEENIQDSGNQLNDTFPAGHPIDSIALDSQPQDATHVDTTFLIDQQR